MKTKPIMTFTVYTDGSGTFAGRPAGVGFAAYIMGELFSEGSLPLARASNQQAEILAAAYALTQLPPGQDVVIVSDSEYLVLGWNEYPRRRRKRNLRHWQRLTEAVARQRSVRFEWTRGHAGTDGNERADRLAREARREAIARAHRPPPPVTREPHDVDVASRAA